MTGGAVRLELLSVVWPHVAACLCLAARLIPIAFLCPALGGPWVPGPVKLGLVLAWTGALHFSAGLGLSPVPSEAWELVSVAGRETALGMGMGLIAALPYEAVRMAGRWMDTFRGASAEASLPGSGSREAATGELLHGLVLGVAVVSLAWPSVLRALWRSFARLPLGQWIPTEEGALEIAHRVGEALGVSLALGAPVAAAVLLADAAVTLATRVAPSVHFHDLAAPLRLLVGAWILWAGLGVVLDRGVEEIARIPEAWLRVLEGGA